MMAGKIKKRRKERKAILVVLSQSLYLLALFKI
jgi:hypothetical protein